MRRRRTLREQIIAEFHFSPLEHALFAELEEEAEVDAALERLLSERHTDRGRG